MSQLSLLGCGSSGGGGFAGILDAYSSNLAGAYDINRRLLGSYNGPLIKLRKASGGESDFSPLASGWLDVAGITTWAGVSPLFLVTQYDQSGNGRHRTQATAGSQPPVDLTSGPDNRVRYNTGAGLYSLGAGTMGAAHTGATTLVQIQNVNGALFYRSDSLADAGGEDIIVISRSPATSIYVQWDNTGNVGTAVTGISGWMVSTARVQSTATKVRQLTNAGSSTDNPGSMTINWDRMKSSSGFYGSAFMAWTRGLSDAEMDALHADFRTLYNL